MRLTRLELEEFRLYRHLSLDVPSAGFGAIGDNASGKSTLVEAIVVLATLRSPRSGSDRELIHWQSGTEFGFPPYARAGGGMETLGGTFQIDLLLQLDQAEGGHLRKSVKVDGRPIRVIDAVGRVKIVLFTPEDVALVSGSPSQRRRYLDMLISQLDGRYLRGLSRYNRILEQRNSLLKSLLKEGRGASATEIASQLSFWNEELIGYGSYLVARRLVTVRRLAAAATRRFAAFGGASSLALSYLGNIGADVSIERADPSDLDALTGVVRRTFEQRLDERRADEVRRGVSLVGPHRDDLAFAIDGVEVGTYGSRGQQRLTVVALKLAEADLMTEEAGEPPLLLLDDVLSELDARNRDRLLTAVAETGAQLVLTATDPDLLQHPAIASLPKALMGEGRPTLSDGGADRDISLQAAAKERKDAMVANDNGRVELMAFIEIPRGSRNKYEFDDRVGRFVLDRVLYSSVHYPTDYGFIPDTLADDGDHLDVLVIVQEPTFPGCLVPIRPLGGLDMADEKGSDSKVLAVPTGDPRFAHVATLKEVGDHWLREIETFFATYKLLEPKQTEVLGWHDEDEARRVIEACRAAYVAKQPAER